MENKNDKKLLYDPMFERYASGEMQNTKHSPVKKIIFIITLSFFVGISMILSFSSISGSGAEYEQTEDGYLLVSYKSNEENNILRADFAVDKNGKAETSAPVTRIRRYTLCCDEYIEFIYIGRFVKEIETNAFYYCKNLKVIFVDEENENYASVDGVLYKKENGKLTEIVVCPMMNSYYITAVSMGYEAPVNYEDAETFIAELRNNSEAIKENHQKREKTFTIPEGIVKIEDLCFNTCSDIETITLPSTLREIGSMAFFRCEAIKKISLPEGLEIIGSDAFSKCTTLNYMFIPSSVSEIGHHAFYDCSGLNEINLGHNDDSELNFGENWLPQKREIFMKDIPAVYGQERSE